MNAYPWPNARSGAEAFSRDAFSALCRHLHNDNPPLEYGMAWRLPNGKKKYVRAKKKRVEQVIQTSAAAVFQTGKSATWTTFVPDAQNAAGLTRWGCLDFDAHGEGEQERAEGYAIAAWNILKNLDRDYILLEHSGAGFHVWIISWEFRPAQEWAELLADVAKTIGAPLKSGVCEIYPAGIGRRKGVRAPGSWHPELNQGNMILAEKIGPLLNLLLVKYGGATSSGFTNTKKHSSFSSSFSKADGVNGLYGEWEKQWQPLFSISQSGTRHDLLMKLVGHVFHQVGHGMARRFAEEQFDGKKVSAQADKKEHLAEFESLWAGLAWCSRAEMSLPANFTFDGLKTDHERDAFRIIHSFSRLGRKRQQPDFPISAASLAARIGVTLQGACHLLKRLVAAGAIRKTQACQPNRQATRYEWLLGWEDDPLLAKMESREEAA